MFSHNINEKQKKSCKIIVWPYSWRKTKTTYDKGSLDGSHLCHVFFMWNLQLPFWFFCLYILLSSLSSKCSLVLKNFPSLSHEKIYWLDDNASQKRALYKSTRMGWDIFWSLISYFCASAISRLTLQIPLTQSYRERRKNRKMLGHILG